MERLMNRPRESSIVPVLMAGFCLLLTLFSFPLHSEARVKGKCRNCHSMHSPDPSPVLTRGGCVGCHGRDPAGARNIIPLGKARVPQVIHNMKDGDLAAGNFYYTADLYERDYGKGHNVAGISMQERPPMNIPPGFAGNVIIPGGTGPAYWPPQQQLTCAGTWGCHGNRTIENPYRSLYGAHHEDDRVIDGLTVGRSYRYLYGIKGWEHEDWEYQATPDNHNGYRGDPGHGATDTISYLCGECHGKLHPSPNLGGRDVGFPVWLKHPTDIAFSSVNGGYGNSEFQWYTRYSLESPVAFRDPRGRESVVDMDSVLMCLSCHRAHASPYQDMLRWDYAGMTEPGRGCLTCHTEKGP